MQPNDNSSAPKNDLSNIPASTGPAAPVVAPTPARDYNSFERNPELVEWLRPVEDPEMFISIIELGLVYEAKFLPETDNKSVEVTMTLTSPHCPIVDVFTGNVKKRALEYPGVETAEVKVVFEPKWNPKEMASDEVKDRLGIW